MTDEQYWVMFIQRMNKLIEVAKQIDRKLDGLITQLQPKVTLVVPPDRPPRQLRDDGGVEHGWREGDGVDHRVTRMEIKGFVCGARTEQLQTSAGHPEMWELCRAELRLTLGGVVCEKGHDAPPHKSR